MRVVCLALVWIACSASACSKRTVATTRFGDDSISSSRTYVDGVLDGPFQLFHPGGQAHVECSYVDGLREGRFSAWFPNGARVATGSYARGLRVGEWSEWTVDGLPLTSGSYTAGDKDGVWILYDDLGRAQYEDTWKCGTRLSRATR